MAKSESIKLKYRTSGHADKIKKTCPRCKNEYTGFSALSRQDNETEICPNCGTLEALDDFFGRL